MDRNKYEFVPAGDLPTVENLKKKLFVAVCMIAVCCSIADHLNFLVRDFYALVVFGLLSLVTGFAFLTNKYILSISIDYRRGKFFVHYLKICGYVGTSMIDMDQVKVTYSANVTKRFLKLSDEETEWCFWETKSQTNKGQKNVFLRDQLEEMHQVLIQYRNATQIDNL